MFLPVGLVGMWVLAQPVTVGGWPVTVIVTAVTAYCIFCLTSLYHETVHQTLWRSKWLSLWTGRAIGTTLGIPYHVYREVHVRHHAYLNTPNDWELWPYSDPEQSLNYRRTFVWIDLLFGSAASIGIYGRIFFHPKSPITSPALRATIWREYVGCAAFWLVVLAIVHATGSWTAFFWAWALPASLAGTYQAFRKLTEHLGMASYDPLLGTRTVLGDGWFTRLCSFVNFDIFVHGPHHRHPRADHTELADRMRDYVASNAAPEYPVFRRYREALADMLPFLIRNPGVGVNAGAAPPNPKWVKVDNFVADVTEEVVRPSLSTAAVALLETPGTAAATLSESNVVLKTIPAAELELREAVALAPDEQRLIGNPLLDNFAHYATFATERTKLFFVKVYHQGEFVGAVPVVKTIKHPSTRLLAPKNRWWLTLLVGPFAKQTSYMVDTTFLAFLDRSAAQAAPGIDATAIKQAVAKYLQGQRDAECVWFSEPATEIGWAREMGFDTFGVLPMAQVELSGFETYDKYLASLNKNRRHNIRRIAEGFTEGGGIIERMTSPLPAADADAMIALLAESSRRTKVAGPYEDVLNHPEAFRTLPQLTLVARAEGRIVAFMSFTEQDGLLWQCHGGLDYGRSLELKAYAHLLDEAVRLAFERGCRRVSFGPLNNETKRRAATTLVPMAGCMWVKIAAFRPFTHHLMIPNFQVYTGRTTGKAAHK